MSHFSRSCVIVSALLAVGCAPKVVAVHVTPDRIEVGLTHPTRHPLQLVSDDAARVVRLDPEGALISSHFAAVHPRTGSEAFQGTFHVARADRPRGYLALAEGGGRAAFTPALWARAPECKAYAAVLTDKLRDVTTDARVAAAKPVRSCLEELPHAPATEAMAAALAADDAWKAATTARAAAEAELATARTRLTTAEQRLASESTRAARLTDAIPRDPNYIGGACTTPSWTRTPKPVGACRPYELDDYKSLCTLREFDDHACIALAEDILGKNHDGWPAWSYSCDDLLEVIDGGTGEYNEVADRLLDNAREAAMEVEDGHEPGIIESFVRVGAAFAATVKKGQLCEAAVERACTRRYSRWESGEEWKEATASRAYQTCQANVTGAAEATANARAAGADAKATRGRIPALEAAVADRRAAEAAAAAKAHAANTTWRVAAAQWTDALTGGDTYGREGVLTSSDPEQYLDRDGERRRW